MLILAIDTAAASCSVALARDGMVVASATEAMPRGQDARLIPLITEILAQGQAGFADLDRIAVLRGPGSFTGIRIGLAAARGLGLALNVPVIGIDRFRIYREILLLNSDLLVVVESKRQELFCRFFPKNGTGEAIFLAAPASLAAYDRAGVYVTGDAAAHLGFKQAIPRPLPQTEAVHAALWAATADPDDPDCRALPLYARPPDVSCGPAPPAEEGP